MYSPLGAATAFSALPKLNHFPMPVLGLGGLASVTRTWCGSGCISPWLSFSFSSSTGVFPTADTGDPVLVAVAGALGLYGRTPCITGHEQPRFSRTQNELGTFVRNNIANGQWRRPSWIAGGTGGGVGRLSLCTRNPFSSAVYCTWMTSPLGASYE
uniref:Uncharacterized protein n=1 Tax=Anopheles merus TaxID=30066 RepID=A0A182UMU0_ANOME